LELNAKSGPFQPPITYLSFGEDTKFEEDQLVKAFGNAGSDTQPTAILVEDNTLFGSANVLKDPDSKDSETLFASLKVERLHGQRFETIRQAKDETLAWLLWYNQTRMHSTLGYLSPIQFEQQWHRTTQAIAS
jgi:hypothetical protein